MYYISSALKIEYEKSQRKEENPIGRLTEEETKVRNANKTKNLTKQADHNRASSNINSLGCINRYNAAEYRLCRWLGENTELKNLKNLSAKYIYPYIESLFDRDCKTSYIRTEMAGIRHFHGLTHSKNILPSNRDLGISEKNDYEFDRSFLPEEFDEMIKVAYSMKRYDVIIVAYLGRYFGLRFEKAVTLRLYQLEDAIRYKQLHLINTKGGRPRDVPVDRAIQEKILHDLVVYLRSSGKKSKDYLICDNHKHSVKKEKASLQNWRSNHSDKLIDPNRREYVNPGCKPRVKRPSWHSLRHLYFQENRRRLMAEGGMTERQVENEMSERLGHSRNDVKKFYSELLKDS